MPLCLQMIMSSCAVAWHGPTSCTLWPACLALSQHMSRMLHGTLLSSPVGHANEQDVVQSVHAINLGQQLVDNGVVHAAAAGHAAALLADGVDLVKDDDVQLGAVALLRLLRLRILQAHTHILEGACCRLCAHVAT